MNRRVRTRTHGGVGGREGRPSLPPDPDVLTLLVNAWWSLSNAPGVGFTRGISLILLGFKHRARGRYSERFGINQQSQSWHGLLSSYSKPLNELLLGYRQGLCHHKKT